MLGHIDEDQPGRQCCLGKVQESQKDLLLSVVLVKEVNYQAEAAV